MFEVACYVDVGPVRQKNDDRVLINHQVVLTGCYESREENVLALVCDGVGGELFGDEAAEIVTVYFSEIYRESFQRNDLTAYIETVQRLVCAAQAKDTAHQRMSTTLAGIYLTGEDFLVFNVGDSRVYRYRPPYMMQLSKDHSVADQMRDMGMTPKPGQLHVITRCIGGEVYAPRIMDGIGRVHENDVYMVCSDGISDVLSDEEMEVVLGKENSLKIACKELCDLAVTKGTRDNMSIILARRVSCNG